MEIRVHIYKNSKNPTGGKTLTLNKSKIEFEDFLEICSQKLGIKAKYVYNSKGCQTEEIEALRDDDDLYISQGEQFFPHESILNSSSVLKSSTNPNNSILEASKNTNMNASLQLNTSQLNDSYRGGKGVPAGLMSPHKKSLFRIALVGEGGVGKSAITFRYVYKKFLDQYSNTIEDFYTRRAYIDNELAEVDILDTAGLEEFKVVRDAAIKEREGFIVVYDVTNPETYQKLHHLYDLIKSFHPTKRMPAVIIGNKIDLPGRQVQFDQGQKMANKYEGAFLECSAKTGENIEEAFAVLIRDIRKQRESHVPKPPKKQSFFKKYCRIL